VLHAVEAARVPARAARGVVAPKGERLDGVDGLVAVAAVIHRTLSHEKALHVDALRGSVARATVEDVAKDLRGVVDGLATAGTQTVHGFLKDLATACAHRERV